MWDKQLLLTSKSKQGAMFGSLCFGGIKPGLTPVREIGICSLIQRSWELGKEQHIPAHTLPSKLRVDICSPSESLFAWGLA